MDLAKAIGAKDRSFLNNYVNGQHIMIGKIQKKKLEAVGGDFDYIITEMRKGENSFSEKKQKAYDQCVGKILEIQKKLTEHSSDVIKVKKMFRRRICFQAVSLWLVFGNSTIAFVLSILCK